MLAYKNIEYTAARQDISGNNPELLAWTGQDSAPVAILDDETPRTSWLDLLFLLERINPAKPLLPSYLEQRALAIGLCRELAGEDGLAWNRRLHMLAPGLQSAEPPANVVRMGQKYGWSESAHASATDKIQTCLEYFTTGLRMQRRLASDYLIGDEVTAVDFYLANFLGMLKPLPPEDNPMPKFMRSAYESLPEELEPLLSEELLNHRAMMYERHIDLPLDF